jgi:hypothetical protein
MGISVAVPPLMILGGVSWEVETAMLGVAALFARDAKSAVNEDVKRRNQAAVVQRHLDALFRAEAIQDLTVWAHDLSKKRTRARVRPIRATVVQPRARTLTVARLPLPVNAGAATPRVMALS